MKFSETLKVEWSFVYVRKYTADSGLVRSEQADHK